MVQLRQGDRTGDAESSPRGQNLIPCMLLRQGQVCLPGQDGPVVARSPEGAAYDPFEVVDRLTREYALLYVVDLDGIERGEPQLDYLQELSRDITLWVDAGTRTADQAIDILITGARRAVLSSAYLRGPRQLKRAWRLSTELVFELEFDSGRLVLPTPEWGTEDPIQLAALVRATGPDHLVISPRETDPDWKLLAQVAAKGPTWIDGSFQARDLARAEAAGALGGIFHIDEILSSGLDQPLPGSGDRS